MKTDNQLPDDDDDAVVTNAPEPQMNHHNVHGCQEDSEAKTAKPLVFRQSGQPRRRYVWFAVVGLACAASFCLGFWISERIRTKREVEKEWQHLFSILQWGLQEGKVEEDWMRELEIIKHESEWDD